MAGLRCIQPSIRKKFFEVFDSSMRRRLHERLMYITCSQNWDTMGPHFWIKQCIELLLMTAVNGTVIQSASTSTLLPSITALINQADSQERESFALASIKDEPMDIERVDNKEDVSVRIQVITFI